MLWSHSLRHSYPETLAAREVSESGGVMAVKVIVAKDWNNGAVALEDR